MGNPNKRARTLWLDLSKRHGKFAANNLTDETFDAVHPFVRIADWSELAPEEDPFRGGQMNVRVLGYILEKVILPRLLPVLDVFETGTEMQTRPWLLALISSYYPLATQCLELSDNRMYLKAEVSDPLREEVQALKSTLESIDSSLGQLLRHEDSTHWEGINKADVTAFAYVKELLAKFKQPDLRSRLATLIAEAKATMKNSFALEWRDGGRWQNGDYLVRTAVWNGTKTPKGHLVYGLGTSLENFSPSAFKLEHLLKIEKGSVVAVQDEDWYLAPGAEGLDTMLKEAQKRVSVAVEAEKDSLPDATYAVGTLYNTTKVGTFLNVPLDPKQIIVVAEGGLALIQALSIILCGPRAKKWTIKHIDDALKAHEDELAERVKNVEVVQKSATLFGEKEFSIF